MINAYNSIAQIQKLVLDSIRPTILVAQIFNNQDLGYEYIFQMEKERNFVFFPMDEIIDDEISRETALG